MSIWPWPQQTEKCENQFGGVIFIHKNYLEKFGNKNKSVLPWGFAFEKMAKGKLGEKIKKKTQNGQKQLFEGRF